MKNPKYLVSSLQLDEFSQGKDIVQEEAIRAEKGAYFIISDISLNRNSEEQWMFIADVNQSVMDVADISNKIKTENDLLTSIQEDI